MKIEITRFKGAREKGGITFVDCLELSQEDTMEGSLLREITGRSLRLHDAAGSVG